jgi:hypothetical protein
MIHLGPAWVYEEIDTTRAHETNPECPGHHEIYLSDPRRIAPEKLKTILRLPVRKKRA